MEEVANPKDLEDYFESVKEYLSVPPVEGEGKQGEVRGYKKRADDKDKDAEKVRRNSCPCFRPVHYF